MDDQAKKAVEVEHALLGFSCPRRPQFGPGGSVFSKPQNDVWQQVGPDRCCSCCGSIHPDDLRALLPTVDGGMVRLEVADRRHKVYIRRPGIRNASEGAIKFYLCHGPPNSDVSFWKMLSDAANLSRRKLLEMARSGIKP